MEQWLRNEKLTTYVRRDGVPHMALTRWFKRARRGILMFRGEKRERRVNRDRGIGEDEDVLFFFRYTRGGHVSIVSR